MTSAYMPDVVVEIAFNAGYSTPAASRTWTDISTYVNLDSSIGIGLGRGDEFGQADANRLDLTLDNTDGRFSPGYASGAYYPNVKLGRPIRVKITPPGGATYTRFLGFVDEWPIEWDGGTSHPKVKITARSRIARLGLDSVIGSSQTPALTAALTASPYALWALTDASAPCVNSVAGSPLTEGGASGVAIGYRLGSSPDGVNTAALFSGSAAAEYLTAALPGIVVPKVIEFFLHVPALVDTAADVLVTFEVTHLSGVDSTTVDSITLGLSNQALTFAMPSGGTVTAPNYGSDHLRHIALAFDATSSRFYLDGTLTTTGAAYTPASTVTALRVNVNVGPNASGRTRSVSYLMLHDDEAGIATRADVAAETGTVSDLLAVLATLGGIESGATDFDPTTEIITYPTTTGSTALDSMRKAEATDGGVLFDATDGDLTYRDREGRYSTTSAFTLAAASQEIEADFAPKLDRTGLTNTATATGVNEASAYVQDSASVADYGLASRSIDTLGNYDQCFQAASWAVYLGKDPDVYVAAVSIDLLAVPTATRDLILAAQVGTRFTISGLPSQAPAASMDFFIEGWTESFGLETHRITFNTTRRTSLYDVWTIEDAVLGQYDAYPIAW